MTLSVLLVDQYPAVREGLRAWLADTEFEVVADVATADEAIEAASRLGPDVVVLDAGVPDAGGAALCEAILQQSPDAAIVVYSGYFDEETVVAAADAGARAYLLKDADEPDLADVLRRVAAGERCVDPRVAAALFRAQGRSGRRRLTEQELSVIRLAAEGFTNREIGARLYLSPHTVKEYLSHAMRKLGVESRVAAVVEAGRRGLLGPVPLSKAS
ncbi:MAG TPA: response regulator transcription factor [Gaiellaceae bacterium]|jgi:DNA-binding NarL/FixJ family response regulator